MTPRAFSMRVDDWELVWKTHIDMHQGPCGNAPSMLIWTFNLDPVLVQEAIFDARLLYDYFWKHSMAPAFLQSEPKKWTSSASMTLSRNVDKLTWHQQQTRKLCHQSGEQVYEWTRENEVVQLQIIMEQQCMLHHTKKKDPQGWHHMACLKETFKSIQMWLCPLQE